MSRRRIAGRGSARGWWASSSALRWSAASASCGSTPAATSRTRSGSTCGSRAAAAARGAALPSGRRVIVAIDGVDGAGKTTFGDALAGRVDRPCVRASADDFLNPSAIRYRLSRESPRGFYEDSVDRAALASLLLDPFAAGGSFRLRGFDHVRDEPAGAGPEDAPGDAALILDGLFLHHPELRRHWDLSILLDVPPAVAAERLLRREGKPTRHRYVRGQELYFADVDPAAHAGLVLPW
jgi:uridine kinase